MARARKADSTPRDAADIPYTMRLPDGQSIFLLIPAKWTRRDISGDLLFTVDAVKYLDRIKVMAMRVPPRPSPGWILTLRETLGMTQAELAEELGVDKMTVARWEWGKVKPSAAAAKSLDKLRVRAARKGVRIAA